MAVVGLVGEIDVYTFPQVREELRQLVEDDQLEHLVVDLSGVEYLDSTGIGVLVGGLKKMRAGPEGCFVLAGGSERILHIFRITGLTKVFPMLDSVDKALEWIVAEGTPAA